MSWPRLANPIAFAAFQRGGIQGPRHFASAAFPALAKTGPRARRFSAVTNVAGVAVQTGVALPCEQGWP
eukprot:8872379-Lingulodinium_polyedra.AAC.1